MANDSNRVSSWAAGIEIVNASTPIRASSWALSIEATDASTPIRASSWCLMAEFKAALPPLVTAGGAGPLAQIMDG
jgi:hypothetical protein